MLPAQASICIHNEQELEQRVRGGVEEGDAWYSIYDDADLCAQRLHLSLGCSRQQCCKSAQGLLPLLALW